MQLNSGALQALQALKYKRLGINLDKIKEEGEKKTAAEKETIGGFSVSAFKPLADMPLIGSEP